MGIHSTELRITGYNNKKVPNKFYRSEEIGKHLAIIFPGRRYTSDKPVLYYIIKLLLQMKIDVLSINYDYVIPELQDSHIDEIYERMIVDVKASYETVLSYQEIKYDKITLIGKSLGTIALSHLLKTKTLIKNPSLIWITPLLMENSLLNEIKSPKYPSLFIIGTKDPIYNPTILSKIKETSKSKILEIKGANHLLEDERDLFKSIKNIEIIIEKIREFLI